MTMTPNDKKKICSVSNVYSNNKRVSERFSKISGLSLSDMGEYNEIEKEKILALLEDQQNDQLTNT